MGEYVQMSQPFLLVLMLWLVLTAAAGPAVMATAPYWELHHAYTKTVKHADMQLDKVTVHMCVNLTVKMQEDVSMCVSEGVQTAVQMF